jgi:hypothetical protein
MAKLLPCLIRSVRFGRIMGRRLVRRYVAQELVLSFVPSAEQRLWRTVTRQKQQRVGARVRLRNPMEAFLEEAHSKLSSLVSDLLGQSGRRMLEALGEAAAATILGGLRCRDAVHPFIEALAEGESNLSWACMRALLDIRSRRGARRLMQIVRGKYPLRARQEAIYTLWQLDELRAEPLFLHICAAVDTEEEYTRDMATEALGNTALRPRTRRALAERLSDPSPTIRYAALCACSRMNRNYVPCEFPGFLRRALEAKLGDPDRVDDNRVIAELAAELLGPHRCPA